LLKRSFKTVKELHKAKREIAKKFSLPIIPNSEILKTLTESDKKNNPLLVSLLKKRAMRTMSGIAPVAVLTKPYKCPGTCAFCPTEKDVPQSYLSNEPAVMRAIRCSYDPYIQVQDRIKALVANGHNPTKIELIVIGGTWSYFPKKYKYWYIANCFKAANDFSLRQGFGRQVNDSKIKKSMSISELETILQKEQKRNERAKYNIIGLTLETRPDYINEKEVKEMRELGCTRVEIGVQSLDEQVLKLNKRGHGVNETIKATKLLKDYGFKMTYHIMPGLPGSNLKKDFDTFKRLFNDPDFQPDQIKFYPCVVTKGSLMYKWWQQGKYKPYTEKQLRTLIAKCKSIIPEYVRVIRLIRDIPGESIVAGNKITNLRQVMLKEGLQCNCIRCREIGTEKYSIRNIQYSIICYQASGGEEYFIQVVSKDNKLLGFCRLRLGSVAFIRELHVYGELTQVGDKGKVQHVGLGKKLLKKAEEIVKKNNYKELKIISGVGVRNYYRKNAYRLKDTYMVKKF
jgi:elongator complex protein 3